MRKLLIICLFCISGCSSTQIVPAKFEVDSTEIAEKALEANTAFDIYSDAAIEAAENEDDKEVLRELSDDIKEDLKELWLQAAKHAEDVKENRD